MKVKGYNANAALRNFRDRLFSDGYGNFRVVHQYSNGHYILSDNTLNLYVIYKRDWFIKFSDQFPHFIKQFPHMDGYGESINEECLSRAIERECQYVVFIHSDGIYIQSSLMIYRFCNKYLLKRVQQRSNMYKDIGGKMRSITETTYSFPKYLLRPIEEVLVKNEIKLP